MAVTKLAAILCLVLHASAAQLPELRTEPTAGGSIFYVKNTSTQPLTAYLIELVDYPGSSYSLFHDEPSAPIAPGAEKRIPVTNMTVGAVPDYVKLQAAIYADGSTAGVPEKVTSLVERRRFILETTRELIRRIEQMPDRSALIANLKEWAASMQPQGRRVTQASINQAAGRSIIQDALAKINFGSTKDALVGLKASERLLSNGR